MADAGVIEKSHAELDEENKVLKNLENNDNAPVAQKKKKKKKKKKS